MNATLVTAVIVVTFVALGGRGCSGADHQYVFHDHLRRAQRHQLPGTFRGESELSADVPHEVVSSLLGAVASFFMMFQMQPVYALLALITMALIYLGLRPRPRGGAGSLGGDQGRALPDDAPAPGDDPEEPGRRRICPNWRPSFIAISDASQQRIAAFELLRWLSNYYGFGTYIHLIPGALDAETKRSAEHVMDQLIGQVHQSSAVLYVNTIVSPSQRTAVAQIVQMPGVAGMENNSILFEFPKDEPHLLETIADSCKLPPVGGIQHLHSAFERPAFRLPQHDSHLADARGLAATPTS